MPSLPPDFFEKPRRTEPVTGLIIFDGPEEMDVSATGFFTAAGCALGSGFVDVAGIGVGVPAPGSVTGNGSTTSADVGINRRWPLRKLRSGPRPFHEDRAVTETLYKRAHGVTHRFVALLDLWCG